MTRLLVLDVDGCLTDGQIVYTESGDERKAFHVHDGFAIVNWLRLGREVAIITGRESNIVRRRAEELGVRHLYQGVRDKLTVFLQLCESLQISPNETAAIGDDLNDYRLLSACGRAFAPNNAHHRVTAIADVVLSRRGGEGAVREMVELLVRDEGLSEEYLAPWI